MPELVGGRDLAVEHLVMNPNQIKAFIETSYPGIASERRRNPDGCALFQGTVQKGSNPSRIARVLQRRPGAPVNFKSAVSARLQRDKALEIELKGGEAELRMLFDRELARWYQHFG
jgi:hypothetical protein